MTVNSKYVVIKQIILELLELIVNKLSIVFYANRITLLLKRDMLLIFHILLAAIPPNDLEKRR